MNTPPTATLERPTIFEQIGGAAAIEAAVEAFYERVLSDSLLQSFFVDVDMAMQKTKQIEFLSQALGGPVQYRGPSMKQAHAHLPIEERHFNRVAEHLVHTLQALQVPQDLIDQIVTLVGPLAADIVNTPTAPEGQTEYSQSTNQNGRNSSMSTQGSQGSAAVMDAPATANLLESTTALRATLDSLQSNVLMADTNFTIVYANARSLKTLETLREQIKESFGVQIEDILGGSIHRFHKDPKRIEKILQNPASLPHEAEFTFGTTTLAARVNAIYDSNQTATGYVVVWEDVTEKAKLEAESARIQNMMENAPVNVIYADKDFNITYVNPASIKTLKTIEELLPCKVEDLLGQSIDIFHKNPAHQRKLLSDPKNLPHRAQIQVGPETLDLLVSAIYDNQGNYTGPMVTWSVVTQQLKTEAEMAQVRNMMENAPINVMFVDLDLTLRYMNPASAKTLKTVEHLLPIKVDQMIGQSIDIFHKKPEHQRKLLANPKNLPYQTNIQLGDEILDLLVSAIYDQNQEYVGAMATWEIVTEQEKMKAQALDYEGKMIAIGRAQAMIEFNMDGTIITANDNFCKCLGYSLDEIKGKHHSMFADPVYAASPEYQAFWAKLNRGEFDAGVYRRMAKGGNRIWIQASYNPILDADGKPLKVVKFATDITAEKNQAAEFEGKIESISKAQAVIEFNMDGTVITANDNFCQCLGYSLDEIKGKHHRMFADPAYASSPEYQEFWAKLNRGEYDAAQYKRLGKGGKEIWIQASYNPILDANDKPFKVVKFATDITAQKEQEVKLQQGVSQIAEIGTNLASASEELTATSQQMAGTAGETSSQANVVAAAAEEVSKNVQSVATGAEEMSATIKEVAKNTTESAKVAGQAVSVADSANTTVAKLGESSAEIGSIIKVITSIAQQTNLLALNATIEAARAGEAGKGFAVVANEVKELAKETTKATENIGRMIDTIQTDTKGAVEAIAQISAIIKQVNDFQNTIASAVEEQSATTNEMTRNVAEASKGSSEIAGNITSVAQAAKGTTDGANDTQTAAKELSKMASDLQTVLTTLT